MRFNKLDLNQLVVLDAVLSERSVKKAADRLFLSAPATSCALARLREYFEDDLLQQVGKTLVLTPKAESLTRPVRDVLMQVQAITTTNPTFDPSTSTRKITVEASDYVMNVFLGEVIKRAAREAPLVQFDLRLTGTHSHSDLENGEVDVLIVPEFFVAPGHPTERLFIDTWSCVRWVGQHTEQRKWNLKQYLSLGHVVCEWGAGRLTSSDERVALRHGYIRRREVTAPNYTVIPQLLLGTSRVATLQTRLAQQLALSAPLKLLPCPLPMPALVEVAQWHKHRDRDLALVWFRGLLGRVARALEASPTAQRRNDQPSTLGSTAGRLPATGTKAPPRSRREPPS